MTCPNCGAPSTPNARHCSTCGALLAGAINRPISGATPSVYAPATATPSACGPDRELQPGTVLNGRYRIEHVLGSGSFGRVYRAVDISDASNLQVAIKELLDSPFTSPQDKQETITWFKREVGVLLALDHPGIPAIHGYWTAHRTAGPFYLAMDYVPGKTLENTLRDGGGRIHWRSVADWGIALCDVLSYLHSRMPPFVFRDLKLPNVMLDTRTGLPVLIDFGITRQMAASGGTAIGTWGYVPYEQVLGKAEPRSDLYALGATLHALLTGRQPDVEYTRLQRSGLDVERTMRALFPPADTLAPDVPLALAQIVTKATSFDVADRFPDAATMGSALCQALGYCSHVIQSGVRVPSAIPPRPAISTPRIPPTVAVISPAPPNNPVIVKQATPTPMAAPTFSRSLTLPSTANIEHRVMIWASQNKGKIVTTTTTPQRKVVVRQEYRNPVRLTFRRFLLWLALGIVLGFAVALMADVSFYASGGPSAASSGSAGGTYLLCLVVVPIAFIVWKKGGGRRRKFFITVTAVPVVNPPSSLHVQVSATEASNEAQGYLNGLVYALRA